MHGIICSFYENGTCTHTSQVLSVPDGLSLVDQYNGKDILVVGSDSDTGEALIRSSYSIYEQDGIPIINK